MNINDRDPRYGDTLKYLAHCGKCRKLLVECVCSMETLRTKGNCSNCNGKGGGCDYCDGNGTLTDEQAYALLRDRAAGDSEAEAAVEAFISELESVVGSIAPDATLCSGCGYVQVECVCGLPSFRAYNPEVDGSYEAFDRKREYWFQNTPAYMRHP